jgi:hypothetical protein
MDLVIVLGGMTSQLQILDVAVNKPFKVWLHCLLGQWLLSGNCPLTPAGNMRTTFEADWDRLGWYFTRIHRHWV